MFWRLICCFSTLTVLGCGSVDPRPSFNALEADLATRVPQKVHWIQGTAEDHEIAEYVASTLKKELSADDAVQIALFNNHHLQSIYEELGVSQASLVQAGKLRNPKLSGFYLTPAATGSAAIAGIDLALNFLDLFYIPMRKRIEKARLEETRARISVEVLRLAGQVRMSFYEYQASLAREEVLKLASNVAKGSADATDELRKAGNTTELALEQERDFNDQASLDLTGAEASTAEKREKLIRLLGLWGDNASAMKIQSRLPDMPEIAALPENLEQEVLDKSFELAASRKRIEAVSQEAGLKNWEALLPEFELGPSSELEGKIWHVGPGAGLSLPIFDQGQGKKAMVNARLRQELAEYVQFVVEERSQARFCQKRLKAARERATFIQSTVIPRREKIYKESVLHYNAMQVSMFQLLNIKRKEGEAGLSLIEALRDYWVSQSALDILRAGAALDMDAVKFSSSMSSTQNSHE